MEWKPATIESVNRILQEDLARCSHKQAAVYATYRREPYLAPIVRLESVDSVVVVARKGNQVIYWEDVEEGFAVSAVGADGEILEQNSNQDDLGNALDSWIEEFDF